MKKIGLFFAFLTLLAAFDSHGRAPSVDPIREINTEHYNNVAPDKAKGFNFTTPSKNNAKKKTSLRPENSTSERSVASTDSKSSFSLFWFALLLPLAVWFGAMRSFKDNKEIQKSFADKIIKMNPKDRSNHGNDDSDIAA